MTDAMFASTSPLPLSSIQTSTFWIGFYGLLQIILWLKIMTIRAVQPASTLQVQNLAVSKDVRNICVTRAHGNYTENAPLFSLLLLVIDASGVVPTFYVDILGGIFAFGRIFHMMGMWANGGSTVGRMVGALVTLMSLTLGSCMAIYSAVQLVGGLSAIQVRLGAIAMMMLSGRMFAGILVNGY